MSEAGQLYPWTAPLAERLSADLARWPHALLLHGPSGVGKGALAAELGRRLLCQQATPGGGACGACQSCLLIAAGNHPDYLVIEPAEQGKAILIEPIRALADFLYLRPHIAARRVVILSPADAMNINAANSLLKLLEEPPADAYLILVSARRSRLPATVRSRCSALMVAPPKRSLGLAWLAENAGLDGTRAARLLELAGGAPLRARELAELDFLALREDLLTDLEALGTPQGDPLGCAGRWKSLGTQLSLGWLQEAIADLLRLGLAADSASLRNGDLRERLHSLQKRLHLKQLFRFLDTVSEAKSLLGGPLDELLLLEDILIRWSRLNRSPHLHGR